MKHKLLAVLGAATIAASAWAASGRETRAPETNDPSRTTGMAGDLVAAPGRVEAISEDIEVGAEITGRLVAVTVDEGDAVIAGQTIARLDAAEASAKVQSAEARLRIAQADYTRLVNGARAEERREVEAQRLQAEAALDQAETEVARRARLYETGVVAREEYERAERDARLARARRNELVEHARVVTADAREDERERAKAAIELASAQLNEARAFLAKTEIKAPRAGIVTLRHKQAGEMVSPEAGQSLIVTLADTSRLRVRTDVDETDVARLGIGQQAWVCADAFGGRRFAGRVIRIGATLGRKNIRTDEPVEKTDTKVLETLVQLDEGVKLPLGLRVDVYIEAPPRPR